jgi:hypothetical protein
MRLFTFAVVLTLVARIVGFAQIGPASSPTVGSQTDIQAEMVPAGSSQTLLSFPFTPVSTAAVDFFDVITTDPSVVVS